MASSNQFLITFAIVVIVLPTVAKVGDTLVFNYPVGRHNVFKVNGTTFRSCAIPPSNEALTSGSDKITLATPGNKWYFCGVASHCLGGQKLAITVSDGTEAPAPAPSSANGITTYVLQVLSAAIISVFMVIMC